MLLATDIHDVDRVVEFVDRLFPALYDEQPGYVLKGIYQS
jgi:hypothetical protein